jgi:hypothetical protein
MEPIGAIFLRVMETLARRTGHSLTLVGECQETDALRRPTSPDSGPVNNRTRGQNP